MDADPRDHQEEWEEWEAECGRVARSQFPDCERLRTSCRLTRHLPPPHRAELWSLLLSGNVLQGDDEITPHYTASEVAQLFCKRIRRPATPHITAILMPLLHSSTPMELPIASSCLYHLCHKHLPLYLLHEDVVKSTSEKLATDKLCTLLRVLLLYHFPLLAIHLDGVAPEWSQLVGTDPVSGHEGGVIPRVWIGGLFAGTVLRDYDNILRMWDWCICWGEAYAGVYMTVTLLGLNEAVLRNISTREELLVWLRRTCDGGEDAFLSCSTFKDDVCSLFKCEEESNDNTISEVDVPTTPTSQLGELHENEEDYDDDDDGDDDDDFSLGTNNLSKMKEIHCRPIHDELSSSQFVCDNGSGGNVSKVEALMSVEWGDDYEERSVNKSIEFPNRQGGSEGATNEAFASPQQLELIFLSGWISATEQLHRNTPQTYQDVLRSVLDDARLYLETRNLDSNTSWSRSRSRSQSLDDPEEEIDLDETRHGFQEEVERKNDEDNYGFEDYEEEYSSEYSESATSSPMPHVSPLPVKGAPVTHGAKSVTTYGMSMLTKGFNMITHKDTQSTNVEGRPLLPIVPRKWLNGRHRDVPCLGTSVEEVLPCICSNRRYDSGRSIGNDPNLQLLSGVSLAFQNGSVGCLRTVLQGKSESGLPFLPSLDDETRSSPFFFAIDCWPELQDLEQRGGFSDRLCKIPKALQMSYSDVMNASALDTILSILQPLAGQVHIVLIGKGDDLIRCNYGGDPSATLESIRSRIHEESAQLGALALTLAKRGIPHVSILDGGYGSVLRCFWNCENCSEDDILCTSPHKSDVDMELSFDMLFDVDMDSIKTLFLGDTFSADSDDIESDRIASLNDKTKASQLSEASSLLGMGVVDKYLDEESSSENTTSVPSSAAYISDILSSSSSSVTGMAGTFSKKMFSYYNK